MLVYCMSPDYLEDLSKEIPSPTLKMQGYGNFKECIEQLVTVNKKELLGVIIVAEYLDVKDKMFSNLLRKINLTGPTRVVVAVNQEAETVVTFLKETKKRYTDLELFFASDFLMSDYFIMHELVGTLFQDKEPYKKLKKAKSYEICLQQDNITMTPLVPRDILLCCSDVKIRESAADAIVEDDFIQRITDSDLQQLRKYLIKAEHKELFENDFNAAKQLVDSRPRNKYYPFWVRILEDIRAAAV